jgi:hypothetical protein
MTSTRHTPTPGTISSQPAPQTIASVSSCSTTLTNAGSSPCDTDAQFWPPKGGEGTEMSIIHTVTALLARELLTRLTEQPSSTTEPRPNTQNRTDADHPPEHARNR